MSENQAVYPIATMCRLLGLSTSGYYAWAKRAPSRRARDDAMLLAEIRMAHVASHGTYGAPRIQIDLAENGLRVGRKRVARLMAAAGIVGVSRRKFVRTTVKGAGRPAPDLVATSAPKSLISCGLPTSPTSRPRRDSCIWRSFSTPAADALSAGR